MKNSNQWPILILKFSLAWDNDFLIRVQNSSLGMIFVVFGSILWYFGSNLWVTFSCPEEIAHIFSWVHFSTCFLLMEVWGYKGLFISTVLVPLVQAGIITLRTLWISYVSIHYLFHYTESTLINLFDISSELGAFVRLLWDSTLNTLGKPIVFKVPP